MSNQKKLKILHTVYMVMVSILLAVLALLLILSCIDIYRSGASPFTRDSVSRALLTLAPYMGVVLLWVIAGFFLFPASNKENGHLRGTNDIRKNLKILSSKIDGKQCSAVIRKKLRFERVLRMIITIVVAVVWGLACSIALINSLNEAHFPADDPNGEVLHGALTIFFCLILPFVMSIVALFVNQASRKRELAAVKMAIKESAGKPKTTAAEESKKTCAVGIFLQNNQSRILLIVRIVVLVAGGTLLIVGVCNGGARDVVQKAIKICRECIGLG